MSKEICQRCGEKEDDLRILHMECFYDMNELGLPFQKLNGFFTLKVCKSCRAEWMITIKNWFEDKPGRKSCGSGIFVRRYGANVEIPEEEWYEENPGREPVRLKP